MLWRISNYADLSGTGGLLFPGRWHAKGRPIVYLAESPAGALVEMLVHMDRDDLPDGFQLLGVDIGDLTPAAVSGLPGNWRDLAAIPRVLGLNWLQKGESALLRVPSAILPHTWNVLLNPAHADAAKARIVSRERVPLDSRLG
jgi:RES domain-containing protein